MKRRLLAIALVAVMACSVAACGVDGNKENRPAACDIMRIDGYLGIEVTKQELPEVTEADIEESIHSTMVAKEMTESISIKDGKAMEGDVVTVDYVGKLDGKAFEGGTAEDAAITIGAGGYIPGFEEALVGHKKGDKFDANITFPANYGQADLAGKEVVFTFKVKKIDRTLYLELTDEVATKLNGDVEITAEEYKAKEKEKINKLNEESLRSVYSNAIWTELAKRSKVYAYPEKDLEAKEAEISEQLYYQAYMYGYQDVDSFVMDAYGVRLDVMVKDMLKQDYAIAIIAYEQKLKVTDEEYQEILIQYAEQYGYDIADEAKIAEFEEQMTKEAIEEAALYEKVTDFLLDNCKYVEPVVEETTEETTEGTTEEKTEEATE